MIENLKKLALEVGAVSWSRPPMRAITGLAFTDDALVAFAQELSMANFNLFQEAANRIVELEMKLAKIEANILVSHD